MKTVSMKRGFLTIDAAIAIAAVLAVIILMQGSRLWQNVHSKNAVEDLINAKNHILVRFYALPDLSQLTSDLVLAMNIFPKSWSSSQGLIDPWGGAVTVSGAGQQGTITLSALPASVCLSIPMSLLGNFSDIRVNGVSVLHDDQQLDLAKLSQQCSGKNNNAFSLLFSKV